MNSKYCQCNRKSKREALKEKWVTKKILCLECGKYYKLN